MFKVTWDDSSLELAERNKEGNIFKTAVEGIKSLFRSDINDESSFGEGSMRFYKSVENDGTTSLRFTAVVSNNFRDREREIIPESAHQEYVSWATKTGQYPELHLWHSGALSKWGQVDWLDTTDGFLVASGVVDQGKEFIARSIAKDGKDIGVSHGFWSKKDGYFIPWYRTFEISPLPMWAAANEHTSYNLMGDDNVPFSKEKKDWLIAKGMTATAVAEFESSLNNFAKELKARGVDYKDFEPTVDAGTTVTPPAVAAVVVTPPTTDIKEGAAVVATVADTKALDDLTARVGGIETSVKALADAFTAGMAKLSQSEDEKVSGFFKSAVSTLPQGFRASESADNTDAANAAAKALADADKKQRENGWFGEIVLGGMK